MIRAARTAMLHWHWWAALLAVAMVATAGYFFYARQGNAQAAAKGAGRDAAARSVPVAAAAAKTGDVGVYLIGLGSVTPLNTRHGQEPRRRPAREGAVPRGPGGARRRSAGPDRSAPVPGPARAGRGTARARSGAAARTRSSTWSATDAGRAGLDPEAAARHAGVSGRISTRARSRSIRRRSTTPSCSSPTASITAPISGRLGLRLVDAGNMVHATDTTGLVVITQLQPITVVFTIPEDSLPQVMKKLRAGETPDRRRLRPRAEEQARHRLAADGRQSDRSDHRHGAPQGRCSTTRTARCFPTSSSTPGCCWT